MHGEEAKMKDILPKIPYLDVGPHGAVRLAELTPEIFDAVLVAGHSYYGRATLFFGDLLSRRWLRRNCNPFTEEIIKLSQLADRRGTYLLNLSYEWSCTSAATADPSLTGARLLRTLDWPLHGLGRYVVVVRMAGDAGVYDNITWPGFVGVATASAPGRFAAALNQPPMRKWTSFSCTDWTINRIRVWRRPALPPVHLLRQVFDTCRTFLAARDMLTKTPLAMPAFFTLAGIEPHETCVIERTEDGACVRQGPVSISNHWIETVQPSHYRGHDSEGRLRLMEELCNRAASASPFDWVKSPILNPTTRLAVVANPANGRLVVQGWEKNGPATTVFELNQ